ncbi:MAG: integrase family protein [Phenylobacterium sp.]|uniref:tyrosine-type recombinase/integrase n=1 Tax=Phenylobacterium sp. TaxID=1871053 RepID=UPI0027328CD6|nr:integrase family protein [Phenylobacterium sp.]MDP3747074.1 integrase family protein [Phenylobacterium sp.]
MARLKLTELSVKALKPTDKYVSYMDTTTPGFGVRVGLRSKTYIVVRGRARERITIGKFDEVSLAEARAEAKRLLSTAPEPKAASMTFAKAREMFLEENYQGRSPRTKYQVSRLLKLHFKALDGGQLADLTDTDVQRALNKLADRPSEQLHAYRAVRTFLRWCTRPPRRFIKHSPMEGYEPPSRDNRGSRVLSDEELVAVWNAAEVFPRSVFRLMMLWGTRNSETVCIAREWLKDGILTIPGAHVKNGRDHSIPVAPLAQHVLGGFPSGNATHFFPGRWGEGHMTHHALPKLKAEVMEMSGTSGWPT